MKRYFLILIFPMLGGCSDLLEKDPLLGGALTQEIELRINGGFQTKFGYQAFRKLGIDATIANYEPASEDVDLTFFTEDLPAGTVKFFKDESMQTETSTVTIRKEQMSASIFLYADALVGDSIRVNATPSNKNFKIKDSVTMPITQAIIRLVTGGNPDSINGDTCARLEAKTVTKETFEWMWSDISIPVKLGLTSTSSNTGTFYKDDQCTVETTETKILAGSDNVSVYFLTKAESGNVELTAQGDGFPPSDPLILNIKSN